MLARVCLKALELDLIILDEFQRFKHLLEQESEAGELARLLFDAKDHGGARVLLLSATPYRGLIGSAARLRWLHHVDSRWLSHLVPSRRAGCPGGLCQKPSLFPSPIAIP
jgi:hypothetical protein